MNVKELVDKLNTLDQEMEVWVLCSGYGNAFPAQLNDVKFSQERERYGDPYMRVLLIGKED
jgi:hypothetical protein